MSDVWKSLQCNRSFLLRKRRLALYLDVQQSKHNILLSEVTLDVRSMHVLNWLMFEDVMCNS